MADQQITEQRGQAVKRLQSLFDMHSIPFGAPEQLGGLLLNLHENRHFTMDFWSLINTLSDSGSGVLNEQQTLDALVESIAGVGPEALPVHERPGVEELRQLLAGVDVSRPAELPQPIQQPADALLPRAIESRPVAQQTSHTVAANEDSQEKRRAIGDALARLEQSTRELRAQLAELNAEVAASRSLSSNTKEIATAVEPVLDVIHLSEARLNDTASKWDRMSPFSESRSPSLPLEAEEDAMQIGSPRGEAAPPRRPAATAAVVDPPVDSAPVVAHAAAPVAEPGPAPTPAAVAATESVAVQKTTPSPAEQAAPALNPVPIAAPAIPLGQHTPRTVGHRGLATPDPDDDPSIQAPFSNYGRKDTESSSTSRLIIPVLLLAILGAAGYAGSRTEVGQEWLKRAVDSAKDAYRSATGQPSERSATDPVVAPVASNAASPAGSTPGAVQPQQSASAPPDASSARGAALQQNVPPAVTAAAPAPDARRPVETTDSSYGQRGQQMVDASVLHVPSGVMAANLITSRVPAYPEAARAQGIEGAVVMDIVVSQTGMVKYVRVIDGDRHLRGAAEDAVLRWHYKPYLQNGQPVEVATTVRLDFRLPASD